MINFYRKCLIITSLLISVVLNAFSAYQGKLLIKNYRLTDYGSRGNTAWAIVKDNRGILYFGSEGSVIEYDGTSWRSIDLPNKSVVRSLAIDSNGVIYVGGVSEFGYLQPDPTGRLCYVSLIPLVPANKRSFPDVWSVNVVNDEIIFQSAERIFRFRDGVIKTIELNDSYHRSFSIDNIFYVNQKGTGLCFLKDDSIILLPGGEFFSDKEISYMSSFSAGILLIGTRSDGLFLYDFSGNKKNITPLDGTEVSRFLMKNHLYHGTELPGDRYAFATLRNGTVISDKQGNILNYINPYTGSGDFSSYFLYLSNESELWITSSQGISIYNISSPLTYWNEENGLIGISNCVIEYNNKIWVGTYSGLFSLDNMQSAGYASDKMSVSLVQTRNIDTEVWDFLKFDPTGKFNDRTNIRLLAATGKGIYNVDKGTIEFVTDRVGILRLCQSALNPSIIYLSTHPTFYVLQYCNGKWNVLWEKEVTSYVQTVVEDKDGNVWLGTMYYGVFRIGFEKVYLDSRSRQASLIPNSVFDSVPIMRFTKNEGLPNLNKSTTQVFRGDVIISCDGFFTCDKKSDRLIRTDIFGEEVRNWNKTVDDLEEDQYGNIWGLHSEIFDRQLDGKYKVVQLPYLMLMVNGSTLDYYHDNSGVTWIAGEEYLLRYDSKTVHPPKSGDFCSIIRKVTVNNDSVIFYGSGFRSTNENGVFTDTRQQASIPEIPYRNKYISFEYACPYFQDDVPLEYSYLLEGYDNDWSGWTYATQKEYNNLHQAGYLFRVRARNYAGVISREGIYRFVVKPPWYATFYLYIIYILLFTAILYFGIKIYVSRLKKYNLHLEKTVKERTSELRRQKEEIDIQAKKLKGQNEKLIRQRNRLSEMSKTILKTNQDKLKFFTNISHEIRTPLTLILSPIEELLDQENKMSKTEEINKYKIIHKNSSRLLSLVNQIMDMRKLEIQTTNLRASEDNIVSFVGELVSCFQNLAEKTDIELLYLSDEKEIITWFDHDKIEKVLSNLISNAFKYTEQGGRISVKVSLETEELPDNLSMKTVHIGVSDTGVGIEEEILPNIFNIFYHSGNSVSLDQAGIGIGLNMASTLAEIHHGKIEVKSKLGKGSDFTLSIPYGEDYLKDDEKEYEEPENIFSHTTNASLEVMNYLKLSSRKKKTEADKDRKSKLVLIVDDNEDMRSYIMSSLSEKYEFIEAESGTEGYELSVKNHPDLIITDIMMPGMDGYELCEKIKASPDIGYIPVIMLSYKSGDEDVKRGLGLGADAYITKPFNMKLLEARIENLIQTRNGLKERFRKELIYKPAEIVITSKEEKFMKRALQVVEKNISNSRFDVVSFSKEMAMSQSTLYRKLKIITGESTNNFIKDLRLKQAANLLAKNQLTVSEVSLMVGFDDPAYFAKSFKHKFKKSPSEYSQDMNPETMLQETK